MPDSQQNLPDSSTSRTGSPSRGYLDTTVLANALLKLKKDSVGQRALSAIASLLFSETPEYALKEFKAGPLRGWIWCHNKFNETRSLAESFSAIRRVSATPSRNFAASAMQALEEALHASKAQFTSALNRQDAQSDILIDRAMADYYRLYLRRLIVQAWKRRRSLTTQVSMPLPCFIEGVLRENDDGSLSFERYSCPDDAPCAVLMELSKRRADVIRLMETIDAQPQKAENDRRYRALRHIVRTPGKPFSDSMCRSVGDAVFVIMAPPESVILTTNTKDFLPLAQSLGKIVHVP